VLKRSSLRQVREDRFNHIQKCKPTRLTRGTGGALDGEGVLLPPTTGPVCWVLNVREGLQDLGPDPAHEVAHSSTALPLLEVVGGVKGRFGRTIETLMRCDAESAASNQLQFPDPKGCLLCCVANRRERGGRCCTL